MRIEIVGPGTVRLLDENGEDLSSRLNLFRIEVEVDAQSYPTAVLHCHVTQGFSADVDYANVAAKVTYTPQVEGREPCSSLSQHETE